jgi:hypothetical protein
VSALNSAFSLSLEKYEMTDWKPVFSKEVDVKELNVVLLPGRVATTSIFRWLNQSGIKTYKLHEVDRQAINRLRKSRMAENRTVPHFIEQGFHITGEAFKRADPVRVVLPVREPVSRNLSAFRRFVSANRVTVPKNSTIETIVELFEKAVPACRLDNWLNRVLLSVIPVELLQGKIGPSSPISRFDYGRFRCILIRAEAPDDEKCAHLSEFFGRSVSMSQRSETADFHNRAIPQDTQELLRLLGGSLSEAYHEGVRNSLYNRLFYPEFTPSCDAH